MYGEAFDCKHDNVIFLLFRHAYDTHTGKKKKNEYMDALINHDGNPAVAFFALPPN